MNLLAFDSGIGGLGVVREIRHLAPAAGITYLADTACFPYGARPDEFLIPRVLALIGAAIARVQPDAVVIACNTVSTIALVALRAAYRTPFIGCVPPLKPAVQASRSGHVGLLATAATIRRPYLAELITAHAGACTVHSLATPALAPLAEQKFWSGATDLDRIQAAVAPLFKDDQACDIDAIALGCTHYTFLIPELRILYPRITFFDPALPVAKQTVAVAPEPGAASGSNLALFTAMPEHKALAEKLGEFGFSQTAFLPPGNGW